MTQASDFRIERRQVECRIRTQRVSGTESPAYIVNNNSFVMNIYDLYHFRRSHYRHLALSVRRLKSPATQPLFNGSPMLLSNNIKVPYYWPFVREYWSFVMAIPCTKSQQSGSRFHVMTSSWSFVIYIYFVLPRYSNGLSSPSPIWFNDLILLSALCLQCFIVHKYCRYIIAQEIILLVQLLPPSLPLYLSPLL